MVVIRRVRRGAVRFQRTGDALDKEDVVYTPGVDARFRLLDKWIAKIIDLTPATLLRDSRLVEIRELASELLQKLSEIGYDRADRD